MQSERIVQRGAALPLPAPSFDSPARISAPAPHTCDSCKTWQDKQHRHDTSNIHVNFNNGVKHWIHMFDVIQVSTHSHISPISHISVAIHAKLDNTTNIDTSNIHNKLQQWCQALVSYFGCSTSFDSLTHIPDLTHFA